MAASYNAPTLVALPLASFLMPGFPDTLRNSFFQALSELRSNKLRSALSLLGITIGIFCIVAVLTVLDSMQANIRKEVAALGSDVLYIGRWPWTDDGGGYKWWEYLDRPGMSRTELDAVRQRAAGVGAATLVAGAPTGLLQQGEYSMEQATGYAVMTDFDLMQPIELTQGRYLTAAELDGGVAVAVIGGKLSESLFPGGMDPLGGVLAFQGKRFRVVGVTRITGKNAAGFNFDNAMVYPYLASTLDFRSKDYDPMLMVKVASGKPVAEVQSEVEGVLRRVRRVPPGKPANFSINQLSQISKQLDSMFSVINGIGWLVGGFSLLVGLFGIANIMFVTVKERTRFIGLKKAIGARNREILTEFLTEAVVLCLLGGLAGLLLVALLGWVMTQAFDFPVTLSLKNLFVGIGVSSLVGLLAGFIPARRAARLNPVTAIRSN